MSTLYPQHMRTILAYIDALNAAEKVITSSDEYDNDLLLEIRFVLDGECVGRLVDEIGGVWSYTDEDRGQP